MDIFIKYYRRILFNYRKYFLSHYFSWLLCTLLIFLGFVLIMIIKPASILLMIYMFIILFHLFFSLRVLYKIEGKNFSNSVYSTMDLIKNHSRKKM